MYCMNCGFLNEDSSMYCIQCGNRLTATVPVAVSFGGSAGEAPASTVIPPSRMTLLRASNGDSYEATSFPATVGKGSAATLRIDGNNTISRIHVRIVQSGGVLVLEEQGATNNTYLNGRQLATGESTPLSNGDVLKLAEEEFTVIVQ